jgi:hypothetical protein
MPEGVRVSVIGESLAGPRAVLTLTTASRMLVASVVRGEPSKEAVVEAWGDRRLCFFVPEALTGPFTVTVRSSLGSAAWTVGLPAGSWRPFLLWSRGRPAVAAERLAATAPPKSLASLNARAARGRFPASAAAAEAAIAGGTPDPLALWPVMGASGYFLLQPKDLQGGVVPPGGYLIYEGRFFGDPLTGHFQWVALHASPGSPAAFRHAARLFVLRTCHAPPKASCLPG